MKIPPKINILIVLSLILISGWIVYQNYKPGKPLVQPEHFGYDSVPKLEMPENLLKNGDFEEQGEKNKAEYWLDYKGGYERVKDSKNENWRIRLENKDKETNSAAEQTVILNQETKQPVFVGAEVWGENIENSVDGYYGASIYLQIFLQDGTIVYNNSLANYGSFGKRWIGINTGSLKEVNQPIQKITIRLSLIDASGVAYFDNIKALEFKPTEAAITIMIDDGKRSTWDDIRPVLDSYEMPGVTAVISGNVDKDGFMTWKELSQLQDRGWEIVSHSISHPDIKTLAKRDIDIELKESKAAIAEHGLKVKNFAYPYGSYSDYIYAQTAKYYRSGRAYVDGTNPKGVFPFDIRVKSIYDRTTVDEVEEWLREVKKNKEWVIISFHVIGDSGPDEYHIALSTFKNIIKVIAESNIQIVTYDQGLDIFAVNNDS